MKKNFALFSLASIFTVIISFFAGIGGAIIGTTFFDEDTLEDTAQEITSQKVQIIDEQSAIIKVAQEASDSVVSIVITKDVPVYEEFYYNPFGNDPFYEDFSVPQKRQNGTEEQQVGAGTGFIISADGMIITNRHVVSDQNASYTVFFNDGKKIEAKVIARDTLLDIAFLQIDTDTELTPLPLGSSVSLKVGQTVVAIGNALGEFSNSVSAGIVSGLSRDIVASDSRGTNAQQIDNVIQTDASINPGNSGGPLLDIEGNVIGVNVAVATNAENIGFAIPVDVVKDLLNRVQEDGTIARPQLGVRYRMITEDFAERNNIDVENGAIITRGESMDDLAVLPGSPADKAGLKENDIILKVDDTEINVEDHLAEVIQSYQVDETVTLSVWRSGDVFNVEVTLEERN